MIEQLQNWFEAGKALWEMAGPVVTAVFSVLAWLWAKRAARAAKSQAEAAENRAAESVSVVLAADDGRKLTLPWQPARREVGSRAGLFGVIGAVAGARRFDLGHGLLRAVSGGAYEAMLRGETDLVVISCPGREFDEFVADAEAFQHGAGVSLGSSVCV